LSTVILASAALVAIIGGLLVARFVGLDSDQQTTGRVLREADGRLNAARRRAEEDQEDLLRWDALDFLMQQDVLDAMAQGVSDLTVLKPLARTRLTDQKLQPFVASVMEEFGRAQALLADPGMIDRIYEYGAWDYLRKSVRNPPQIRWPRVWDTVFNEVYRRRYGSNPPSNPPPSADMSQYELQRRDDLAANYERSQQRVEDSQDELWRLQDVHAEIIRPDKRLWFGVTVLVVYAAVGVAWPLFVMSQGPTDLAQVRWVVWPFMAALLILIVYVVVYLATITRRKSPLVTDAVGDNTPTSPQTEPGDFSPDWTSRLFDLIWPH
jgi:hypothetical protein